MVTFSSVFKNQIYSQPIYKSPLHIEIQTNSVLVAGKSTHFRVKSDKLMKKERDKSLTLNTESELLLQGLMK
jgi:hypothetical protein